jgi:type I restriction enzyme S subunit
MDFNYMNNRKLVQKEEEKIPKGWNLVSLKEVTTDLIGGGTPSTSQPEYWDGDIPWMTSANLTDRVVLHGMRNITEKGLRDSATNIVPKDSLLMSTRVGIGKVGITGIDVAISQDLTGLVADKSKADIEYLYWTILNKSSQLSGLSQGSTVKGLTRDYVKNLKTLLPPLPEQKRVAEILSAVDQAIEKVDEAIKKTQRLKNGLMQELLTRGIGHKEFKDTEVGKIPKEWSVVDLSEIFKLSSGKSRPQEISDIPTKEMEYPIYGGNGILGYTNRFNTSKETIVIGRVGEYCGSIHITLPFAWVTDNALYAAEFLNYDISLDFLKFFLVHINLNRFKKESGQPLMTQAIIYSIKMPTPPQPEQQKIAEILSAVDKRLDFLSTRKERLEKIKRGLMNELLTGKKRVRLEV